jgi:hypothetical protein
MVRTIMLDLGQGFADCDLWHFCCNEVIKRLGMCVAEFIQNHLRHVFGFVFRLLDIGQLAKIGLILGRAAFVFHCTVANVNGIFCILFTCTLWVRFLYQG